MPKAGGGRLCFVEWMRVFRTIDLARSQDQDPVSHVSGQDPGGFFLSLGILVALAGVSAFIACGWFAFFGREVIAIVHMRGGLTRVCVGVVSLSGAVWILE
jgi:hypothetical protein